MGEAQVNGMQESYSPAMVFTSRVGQLVFVNRKFARLVGDTRSGTMGSLQDVLPIPSNSFNQLIETVQNSSNGQTAHFPVSMPTPQGQIWKSNCSAVAAFDIQGAIIGIDLVLADAVPPAVEGTIPGVQTHSDTVMNYVQDVFNESKVRQSATFTQSYLIAHLEVLQILLARMAGPATRPAFEQIINITAHDYLIPCVIQLGHLTFTEKNIDIQKYIVLLKTAASYAINVLGRQTVKQEMLRVDQFIEPGLLQLVSQWDLNAVFQD